jgi:spermidine synthase
VGLAACYVIAFVVAYAVPEDIHRGEFDKAVAAWSRDRSPQNKRALEDQRHKTQLIHITDSSIIAAVLVTLGYGDFYAIRYARLRSAR